MAVLGEIRKRSWILIAVVALGLLAFLIEPGSLINNLKQVNPNNYGEVNDRVITREDYDAMMLSARQQNQGRMPETLLRNRAWEGAIQNKLIHIQAEKAGLEVNEEVVYAYNPDLKGQIDELQSLANSGNAQAKQQLQGIPDFMKAQVASLRTNLYNSLVSTTLLTNKLEVQHAQKNAGTQAVIDYVKVDYDKYNAKDKTEVSDQDLQKYINEHKNLFKREASRNLHYVYFPNNPSTGDKAMFEKNLEAFKNGGIEYDIETAKPMDSIQSFASANNDSLYVAQYSLEPFNGNYYGVQQISQQFTPEVANWVKTANVGSVYGPFEKNDLYILSKLSGKKPLDSIKTKHILVSYAGGQNPNVTRSKEEAEALANELLAQVKANPASFAVMARENSDDPGSAQRGGDLGWVTENTPFVPEYLNFLKNNASGTIGIAESQFGYHIISVDAKKQGTSYQLANVIRESRASKETEDKLYQKANAFLAEVKDGSLQDFVNKATQNKYTQNEVKEVSRFQGVIQPLSSDKDDDIIAWTFQPDNEVGDTNIFTTTKGDYVVVRLTGKAEKGIATPKQIREEYESIVRNEKIAEKAKKTFKDKSIDVLAVEYEGTKATDSLNMAQYVLPKSGFEPKVVGAAFGMKPNTTSGAIGGNSGLYKIQLKSKTDNANQANAEQLKARLEQQNRAQTNAIFQSLRREAEVEDDRAKIFR